MNDAGVKENDYGNFGELAAGANPDIAHRGLRRNQIKARALARNPATTIIFPRGSRICRDGHQ
jgi:hypothetical protein